EIVQIDAQIDVIEVVADLREQLDGSERKRAVDGGLDSADVELVIAARTGAFELIACLAEIDIGDLERNVRIEAPASKGSPRVVVIVDSLNGFVGVVDVVYLDVVRAPSGAEIK